MIGLGITTYNRPDYLAKSLEAVLKHLTGVVDHIVIYNDASTVPYTYNDPQNRVHVIEGKQNRGVAHAKNQCLKYLMDKGCHYLFLAEDDIVVQNRGAITQYIALSRHLGTHHLMFAHHGPGNEKGSFASKDGVYEVFENCVGAWTYYSRAAIEKVGYMDENFTNAWEHMEHTSRICNANMCPPFGHFMDVWDSTQYLKEIPGSIDASSIRQDDAWKAKMLEGLYYWKAKDKKFPMQHSIDLLESGNAFLS